MTSEAVVALRLDERIASFKRSKLEIDCIQMTLTQGGVSIPIVFKGKGYIRQNDEDALSFKIYAETLSATDLKKQIDTVIAVKQGQLFSDDVLYTLAVTADDGTLWTADRIYPNCSLLDFSNPIVTGTIQVLSTEYSVNRSENLLRLHFFDDVSVPCLEMSEHRTADEVTHKRDTSKFSAAGMSFTVRRADDELIVDVESSANLIKALPTRIEESLSYMTARLLECRVLLMHDDQRHRIEFVSRKRKPAKVKLEPPLVPNNLEYNLRYGWRLFGCYLEYVLKNTRHTYWNHCSYHLQNACEASAGSVDMWAVGVSVAVEALAGLLPLEKNDEEQCKIKKFRKWLLDQTKSHPVYVVFLDRLRKLLGMLTNLSVPDRLYPLVASGHVEKECIDAWKQLRNKHVHPKEIDIEKVTRGDFQELIDLIHKTTVLMYQITFHLIGYQGKYTDYGAVNWPAKDYPLPKPMDGKAGSDTEEEGD